MVLKLFVINMDIYSQGSLKGTPVNKGSSVEIPRVQNQAKLRAADVGVFPVKMLWGLMTRLRSLLPRLTS